MSYATIADFQNAYGKEAISLTNLDNPSATTVNEPVLNRALDDASNEIDTYLIAAGYPLPLASNPPTLREKCLSIARYRLNRNRPSEDVRLRYEDAIRFLRDLSSGKASLGLLPGAEPLPDNSLPLYYAGPRTFSNDSLRDYGFNRWRGY